ncbi:cation:proton antiporter [Desulfopila aestuarii]|uniref:Kef-type K+ transport system, membrane component KefB n=1 Tax=Desulfopila aestuarii DSM 18488 TaxID=1121416 RepID=A0A1M7YK74_9BACT|nr:cation:proton antiporter [Desulfopila aestuarii]SHO53024.1 Kef-type K+ transport system, membrane component KefB [Desulfopila aestuarii DSM 18488]
MAKLSQPDLVIFLLALSVMLISSRISSEFGRRIGLPMVMGELIVGVLLGPTVFGTLFPGIYATIFPFATNSHFALALDGVFSLSVILLLFVAGLELRFSLFLRHGKTAMTTGLGSMVLPFASGFAMAWFFPQWFSAEPDNGTHLLFSLFLGTAMSISALPVIARILLDMKLLKTEIGTVIIASAVFNDVVGWIIFSFILSMVNKGHDGGSIQQTMLSIGGFALFMLIAGRFLINRTLPWIQTKLSWPGGVLAFSLSLCLLCASFTEYIRIHAILGAFIAGLAIGDSVYFREQAREIIHQFVTSFFAPLFFVSIGLKVNFIEHFDPAIVLLILLLAFAGKVIGAGVGARIGGMTASKSLAIGFGLNARGAMEMILGSLAYEAGLISHTVFVAIIVMALVTSITSAPLMRMFLDK